MEAWEEALRRESDADIEAAMTSIMDKFDNYDKYSFPNYGWDWLTMQLIFPDDYARYVRLRNELRRRTELDKE